MGQKRQFFGLVTVLALAGCANLAGEVSKRSDAPDWFKGRVKQIEADGYPKFSETNMTPRPRKNAEEWAEVKSDLQAAKSTIDADPRAVSPGPVRNTTEWQRAAKEKVGTTGVEQ